MNRLLKKGIVLIGIIFCFVAVMGTRLYGQVELENLKLDNINMTGFPTDEILLSGEVQQERKRVSVEEINARTTYPKNLKEAVLKKKIAEKEPMGNLYQKQKMIQYPSMDIARQMKKLRAMQWTGRGLWIAGTCLAAAGVWFIDDGIYWEYGAEIAGGVVSLIGGVAGIGVGVIMDIINTTRIKNLKRSMAPTASLDFGNQKYGVGFGLHF